MKQRRLPFPTSPVAWLGLLPVALAAPVLLPVALAAQGMPLPPRLEGLVSVQLLSCDPHGAGNDLRIARVRIQVGASEVMLPDLQCGAFRPGTEHALFLNAVEGLDRLPPGAQRIVEVVFPASGRYSECRCVAGGASSMLRAGGEDPSAWWETERFEQPPEPAEMDEGATRAADGLRAGETPGDSPAEPPSLRTELVLRPGTEIHAGPSSAEAVSGRLAAGDRIAVDAISAGWKRVRREELAGWIRSDASTADLMAPERVGAYLDELAARLSPDGGPAIVLRNCPLSAADALPELVLSLLPEIHTVYVTNLWYALDEDRRDAFHAWVAGCHDVRRIVDMASGAELRGEDWGDHPPTRRVIPGR